MNADKEIADILAKYGEPFAGNVWRVQGNAVIYHKCLERIAANAKIVYDAPVVLRAERDEAVILVTGHMGERTEWSIGEALVNVNYRVSGKQSAYVYAMAEKRAKDRVILKLIELHGLAYSEDEADDFKEGAPEPSQDRTGDRPSNPQDEVASRLPERTFQQLTTEMGRFTNAEALKRWGVANKDAIAALPDGQQQQCRARYERLMQNFRVSA